MVHFLFLRPTLAPFNKEEFEIVCNTFHDTSTQGTIVASTFKPLVQYHVDTWELSGNTLTRIHKRARDTFFAPKGTKDRPVDLKDLSDERVTYFEYADGRKETLTDNWRMAENPKGPSPERFVGRTVFKLSSKPTGRKLAGKQTTLPEPTPLKPKPQPQPQELSVEAPQHFSSSPREASRSKAPRTLFVCAWSRLRQELWKTSRRLCLSNFWRRTRQQDSRTRTTCGLTFRLVGRVSTTSREAHFLCQKTLTLKSSLEMVA